MHGQGQKRDQKHATKDFVEFHNHSSRLTMAKSTSHFAWFAKLFDLRRELYFVKLLINYVTIM